MSEVAETPDAPEAEAEQEEQRVPYERFQKANSKAKEADARAKALESDLADLRAKLEDREQAGLPELERLKKDMERAEKRATEAEAKAADAESKVQRAAKERWVAAAAQEQNFADPADASVFVNLDEIEDPKDAERAIKRLASTKKYLVKNEDPALPGKVLENGRAPVTPETPGTGINASREAEMLVEGLKPFLKDR